MEHTEWVHCPVCGDKTRSQYRAKIFSSSP
ncbi:cysteine-rich KTR domain-containing protein [Qiania dongpingensis]|uniref:Uncharacterized protein n=1 Tax=Qiania dongpingensis TaxID=2763669 RepID=A0A7G9G736_9FIRM|nr:hypothetical protein H9Q78_05725 [Qiania dongpingensis]